MAEVAQAYVSLLFSARGAEKDIERAIGGGADRAGRRAGGKAGKAFGGAFSSGLKVLGGAVAAAGIGQVLKASVGLEASFSKTMAQVAAATDAPASAIDGLDKLALKLGADTAFSANEAADAMLELAKAGISTSDIMGGALEGTLLLATAGSTDLATASTIASNAMNTFALEGSNMSEIAAALAGGANASSASVASLGEALSQVGPGATNAGLSLQETVGVLSAFDAGGVKGSDAGTSLKTMLARLVPQTDAAASAMRKLGLNFTDANGSFLPITNVAQQLQKSLGKLSEEQRTTALTTIFGSDATRAATILMKEGAAGIGEYIDATKDQGAAEKLAKANMSGTAGALERLSGSIETAQLAIGKALAPVIQDVADRLADDVIPAVTDFIEGMQDGTGAGGDFADIAKEVGSGLKDVAEFGKDVFKAIDSLPGPVKKFGAELAIGLVVMSKLRTLTGPLSAGLSTMGTNFRNAETRAAGLKTGLGRLGSGLRNVSGAGGMLLLQHGLTNSNKKLGVLETSLGGFAAGFAVGGPIGAGIGTGIGLFASLKTAISGTNDVKLPTPEQLGISDIVGGLDDIIGKSTEASTALANAFLSGETKGAPPAGVAVGTTIRETARLYGIPDRTVNQALAGNVKAFKAIQAVFAKAVRDDPVLGAIDRDAVVGSLKILIDGFKKERDAKLAAIAATRDYGDSLDALPEGKRLRVEAIGIVPTIAGIARVANEIDATPKEIKTLIQAAGVDATVSDITSVQGKVARLDGQSATVQIGAKLSGDAVKWFGSLGWLGGKTSSSTTVANIATGADGLPRRALGGPVSPGSTYWVGERGPELFTSATRGRITSANGLQSARGGSLAGQRLTLVVDGRQIEGVIAEIADSRVGAQRGIDSMTERAFG